MSNSLWFSRIFTLQSFSWFCFNYFFWLFLRCIWKKITTRVRNFFNNHWIWKFSKFHFFSFPFLKFIYFKITTNSSIYSLVEQFLETLLHKNNYKGKGVYFWKNLPNFSDLYTPYLGWRGYIIRATPNKLAFYFTFVCPNFLLIWWLASSSLIAYSFADLTLFSDTSSDSIKNNYCFVPKLFDSDWRLFQFIFIANDTIDIVCRV